MKKLSMALVILVFVSVSAFLFACKKETTPPEKLPAIQRIRQNVKSEWDIADKTLLQIAITPEQKLNPEYANFETDSNIVVSCRIRFEGEDEDVLLPYIPKSLGAVKIYFFTLAGGKPKLFFHNTAVADFNTSGTASAMPIESVSFTYQKIE